MAVGLAAHATGWEEDTFSISPSQLCYRHRWLDLHWGTFPAGDLDSRPNQRVLSTQKLGLG